MKQEIPKNIKTLLWDVKEADISFDEHYKYIIERVLEYGDLQEIKWMEDNFSKDKIVVTLKVSKRLSAKSANYFALKYNVSKEEVECLRKPYKKKQDRF